MHAPRAAAALAWTLLLAACAPLPPSGPAANRIEVRASSPPITVVPARSALVPFTTIEQGANGGVTEAKREVLRDRRAWSLFWEQHTIGRAPIPPLPAVDFEHEMVVAVSLGLRRSGGYAIAVDSIERTPGELVVRLQESAPPPGAMTAQLLTAPFHLVRVARSDAPVRFVSP